MKRTFTINLNNAVYHIDNDAYELLHQYMNEVETRLSPDEKKEVMADIEARISELFAEKLQKKGKGVINIADVEEVIGILGKPNQFSEEDEEQSQTQPGSTTSGNEKRSRRRFYRDVDNSILGGVASGLSALLGWDVLLIRILMVLLIFLGYGTIIPIYLIVWIIAPAARTVAQKLEMQGEEATAERIKQEINNLKNYVESDKFRENANHMGSRLGEVFRVVFKVIFGFIGAIMGFVGFILLGVLLLLLSFLIFEPTVFAGFIPEASFFGTGWGIAMITTLLLIVGIPIFLLIYWAAKIISGRRERSGTFSWILVIVWFLGIFVFAGLSARTAFHFGKANFGDVDWEWSMEDDNSPEISEMRVVEPFDAIEVSGNIKIELVQDSIPSLQVHCQDAVMPHLITKVENGVLKIYTRKFFVNREVKVNIVNPSIRALDANGASSIRSFGKIRADKLEIELTGASHADLDLHISQDLSVDLSGASKADLQGLAYRLRNSTNGASKLNADELMVRNAVVEGSGASELDCHVTDSLDVRVSGASDFSNQVRPIYTNEHSSGASSIHFR